MKISGSRRVLFLASLLVLAGCSAPGPASSGVGYGRYLQVINDVGVLLESDSAVAGMKTCMETAVHWVQQNPELAGRVRCVGSPTVQPLPYGFKLKAAPAMANEFYPSAPYEIRVLTSRMCRAMLSESLASGESRLVEDRCGP